MLAKLASYFAPYPYPEQKTNKRSKQKSVLSVDLATEETTLLFGTAEAVKSREVKAVKM